MRQGGMKPKGHKSGHYWVRAHSGGSRKRKTKQEEQQEVNPNIAYDSDGDGRADLTGWILHAPVPECPTWLARGIVILILVSICIKYS